MIQFARRPLLIAASVVLSASFGLSACGGDLTNPTREEVAGEYEATSLTVGDGGGQTRDALAAGATFQLSLRSDSTTVGLLFVPAAVTAPGTGEIRMDLTGVWTLSGDGVTLLQRVDDVVRVQNLMVRRNRLEFDFVIAGARLRGVLSRR